MPSVWPRKGLRLRKLAGLEAPKHFHKPIERAFTAEERSRVTILFGGLTWKHEELIRAVFQGTGYRCESCPCRMLPAFQLGKEYGNNGQCNPTYFTVGNLVQYLQSLEAAGHAAPGHSRQLCLLYRRLLRPVPLRHVRSRISLRAEKRGLRRLPRAALPDSDGIKAASGEPGLKFTVDFGLGMLNALHLGDVINDLIYQVRPFEVNKGETDRVFQEAVDELSDDSSRPARRLKSCSARRTGPSRYLQEQEDSCGTPSTRSARFTSISRAMIYLDALNDCRDKMNAIEVDRTQVKPVVKITGEFWAQTTEGDGNFNMFEFLEREGAQVLVEPIATWVAYLMYQAKAHAKREVAGHAPASQSRNGMKLQKHLANQMALRKKLDGHRRRRNACGTTSTTASSRISAASRTIWFRNRSSRDLAHPFYNQFARGGEGHLEVGKNVYYTVNHLCHMVLALKPFGCMPSSQSDGVQSAVINKFKDMIFLPIETSGEGEVNAHSRVQMALGEAKVKAKLEFEQALESTGKSLDDIKSYVAEHPELQRPFYHVPHRPGIAGTAAQFVLHVSDRMDSEQPLLAALACAGGVAVPNVA